MNLDAFNHIPSQTTANDKRALLALHEANRERTRGNFTYLEIGSHLGGSLQALVADPACTKILSIDPRPHRFRDERGLDLTYHDNSTARMLELLGKIPGADLSKIETFESDSTRLNPAEFSTRPDFCFVDGEHTDAAALRDARFCLNVAHANSCIVFHDANIVYRGIDRFLGELATAGIVFRPYILPDAVFVVELGDCQMAQAEPIKSLLAQNHQAYLFALKSNEWYRAVLNKPLFQCLRRTPFVRRLFLVPELDQQGV